LVKKCEIHPNTTISENAIIGKNTTSEPGMMICRSVNIKENSSICANSIIDITYYGNIEANGGFAMKRCQSDRSCYGLYIPPMILCELDDFSFGSVCNVLTYDATPQTIISETLMNL
jgi:hypothetical protein